MQRINDPNRSTKTFWVLLKSDKNEVLSIASLLVALSLDDTVYIIELLDEEAIPVAVLLVCNHTLAYYKAKRCYTRLCIANVEHILEKCLIVLSFFHPL